MVLSAYQRLPGLNSGHLPERQMNGKARLRSGRRSHCDLTEQHTGNTGHQTNEPPHPHPLCTRRPSLATGALIADAPKAEAASCVVNVESWDRLNVRTGPGASYAKKFSLRPGQCGIRVYRDCEGNWCPINFRGKRGWVNTRYIGSEAEGGDDSIGRQRRFNKPIMTASGWTPAASATQVTTCPAPPTASAA
jgi:hypothetical protein